MVVDQTMTDIRSQYQQLLPWISIRKFLALLLIVLAFCLAPFLSQRWQTKSLVESIRGHGGEVRLDQYVCYNGACFYIPLAVSESLSRITYISYTGSNSCPIDDSFVESMNHQPFLCMLKLGDRIHPARITDRSFSAMKQFPELVSLDLTGVTLTDSSYKELS